jgi:hypothetical protein
MLGNYVLDRLVVDLWVEMAFVQRFMDLVGVGLGMAAACELKHWTSSQLSAYLDNFSVRLSDGNTFYIGVRQNNEVRNAYFVKCRLEFNPAKVDTSIAFTYWYNQFIVHGKHVEFKRFDVAIDVDVERENAFLAKDRRQYRQIRNSDSDKTEYLGSRSNHGHVKLYNKQIEANLSSPRTRLEITLDYDNSGYDEFCRLFPKVSIVKTMQMEMESDKLNETDRVLVLACQEHPEYLEMLGRRKRESVSKILETRFDTIEPDRTKYERVKSEILKFGRIVIDITLEQRYQTYIKMLRGIEQ